MNAVVVENLSEPGAIATGPTVHALAWNIERGIVFDGIVDALENHQDLNNKDVTIVTFTGTGTEEGIREKYPEATIRSIVQPPGGQPPLEEVLAIIQRDSGSKLCGDCVESLALLARSGQLAPESVDTVSRIPLAPTKQLDWTAAIAS